MEKRVKLRTRHPKDHGNFKLQSDKIPIDQIPIFLVSFLCKVVVDLQNQAKTCTFQDSFQNLKQGFVVYLEMYGCHSFLFGEGKYSQFYSKAYLEPS